MVVSVSLMGTRKVGLIGIAKQTYVGAIISKVVDNVQINVKNIHIRYEDGTNTPDVSPGLFV